MKEHGDIWQERRLEEILFAQSDKDTKINDVIRIGFEPSTALEIVEQHEAGLQAPAYYERLNFADLDNAPDFPSPLPN